MESLILGLLAETSIHAGAGRSLGAIDLPVAREAATDYPVIVGSSLKGALKDALILPKDGEQRATIKSVFGTQKEAGHLLVSDARLLLLPARSLTGQYKWITCPHVLERLARDKARAGIICASAKETTLPTSESGDVEGQAPSLASKNIPMVAPRQALANGGRNGRLFLEEREFVITDEVPESVRVSIEPLLPRFIADRLKEQLVVLSNDDFAWFARYGLSVQARNVLDANTKTSTGLWYEETLPPDTLMYALLAERREGTISAVVETFKIRPYLQVGGNETIGQGIFLVSVLQ